MRDNVNAHLAVLFATFIVATSFPIGQSIAPHLDPVVTVFFRFIISIILMLPLLFFTNKIKIPTRKRLIQFSLLGATQSGFFILMFLALRDTSSLNTSVIYTLLPSLAAIASFYILKEKLRILHSYLLPIGIAATIWVIFEGSLAKMLALNLNNGDLIFSLGLILLAIYTTLLKKFHEGGSPFDVVFWSMVCAVFPMALYSAFISSEVNLELIPVNIYLMIIYLSVMTVLTNVVWAYGTPKIGAMKTLAYSYLIPTFVLFINWILIGQLPPMIVLPGVIIGFMIMLFLQFSAGSANKNAAIITNRHK